MKSGRAASAGQKAFFTSWFITFDLSTIQSCSGSPGGEMTGLPESIPNIPFLTKQTSLFYLYLRFHYDPPIPERTTQRPIPNGAE
jgi:hypothetical protein